MLRFNKKYVPEQSTAASPERSLKFYMRILFSILFFAPTLCTAQKEAKDSILYVFYGDRNDLTSCDYTFYKNGKAICDETGHLAMGYTIGSFVIKKDTVVITPLPADQQTDKYYYHFKRKFLIEGDSSLIDLEIFYDYRRALPGDNPFYVSHKRNK